MDPLLDAVRRGDAAVVAALLLRGALSDPTLDPAAVYGLALLTAAQGRWTAGRPISSTSAIA
jgi:hypothetical protein